MTRARHAVVTGGAGFLGSWLCGRLLEDGWRVTCLDNQVTGSRGNVAALLADARFDYRLADIAADPTLGGLTTCDGSIDVVYHLASLASPVHYQRLPIDTLLVGSSGTLNALELARRAGARFVLSSTSEVYGDPLEHPQTEGYWGNVNPVGERSMYDESKRFAEALTTAYRGSHGVDTGIVRIFNTYGPRMAVDDGRMIPMFIGQALRGMPLTVTGDGMQTRSLCFVSDTIDGLVAMAASPEAGPINIGNPAETTVRAVAEAIIARVGSASVLEYVDSRADDPQRRCPDISTAWRLLGWQPRVSWQDGLDATLDWFADRLGVGARVLAAGLGASR